MSKILLLGTSHTQGECERGGSEFIDKDKCYYTFLSNLLDKEIIRLSRGGIDNFELGTMFNSFREHRADVFADVDTVIAEVRYGTEWVPFPAEQVGVAMRSNLDGFAYEVAEDFGGKDSHINATQYPWNTQQKQLLASIEDSDDRNILKSMFPTMQLYMRNAEVITRNVYDTLMIYELCKLLGIQFYWFTMTVINIEKDNPNNNAVIEKLESEYPDFYSKRLCEEGVQEQLGLHWKNSSCECRHYDEKFQQPIAEFLYKKLLEKGYDK